MEEIKVYNTLTKEKEVFHPIKEGEAKIYVCGVTPYNHPHIGNARPAVTWDIIRRYLEFIGYKVTFVQNFTDVDDKIINKANAEGSDWKTISDRYIDAYFEVMDKLHVRRADMYPRVSDHMKDIIDMVKTLIEKGHAYVLGGDVYYDISTFKDYGKLSGRKIEDMLAGARIEVNDEKRNPGDFALWKAAKPGEPFWESPWGKGRPGWHIECSVMATKYLGDTIDIHGGGHDLTFPHHENEIAQSEAKTGKTFANYWMHNGFVTIGETAEKMSKSLGNFVTVHDILKEVDPQVLRFFLGTAHYRRPVKYSEKAIEEAKINLEKVKIAYQNAHYRLQDAVAALPDDAEQLALFQNLQAQFVAEMDDDFQADNAMSIVYQFAKELNIYAEGEAVSEAVITAALALYKAMVGVFGVVLGEEALLDDDIQTLIDERTQARTDKNFARSDEIRDYLKDQGIILDDTAQGTRWRRA